MRRFKPRKAGFLAGFALFLQPFHAYGEPAPAEPESFECIIEPETVAEIGSSAPGIIEFLGVELGDRVDDGDVIAQLMADFERAAVKVAEARYKASAKVSSATIQQEFSKRRVDRVNELATGHFASAFDVDEALTEERLAEMSLLEAKQEQALALAELERARVLLAQKTIRAPFTGVVTEVYVDPGERIEEQAIVRLAKIDPLIVEVLLPIRMLGSIAVGNVGVLSTEQDRDAALEATVVTVDPVVDAASGLFRARLELPNPRTEITAGLQCSLTFGSFDLAPRSSVGASASDTAIEREGG